MKKIALLIALLAVLATATPALAVAPATMIWQGVYEARPSTIFDNCTTIWHETLNGNPSATMTAVPYDNYPTYPYGIWTMYDQDKERWVICNDDAGIYAPMEVGSTFLVTILVPSTTYQIFLPLVSR